MPHNYQDYDVVQVAFPRHCRVLARLKAEALRYTGRANAGPHIYELLVDRDAHVYGTAEGNGKGIWFPASSQVIVAVRDQNQEPPAVIGESDADLIEKQAESFAATFDDDE